MMPQDLKELMPLPPKESVVRKLFLDNKVLTEKELSVMSTRDLEEFMFEKYILMPMRKTKKIKAIVKENEYGEEEDFTEKISDDWLLIPIENEEKIKDLGLLVQGVPFYN